MIGNTGGLGAIAPPLTHDARVNHPTHGVNLRTQLSQSPVTERNHPALVSLLRTV
ncbi:MAG: hypothetical protein KME20_16140 [Kaiparowitsia implicata GSE-PSE-MK54-09C]|nr:hypothetical protein [Kaiparowitsia implicata GSE-PSE-MK54-09C]